ncbi:MAG: tRNA uridine-5-carboxymethylaminomethyl(34) synthesis GTPase MnmE [Gemmatimonadaceae bacterium]
MTSRTAILPGATDTIVAQATLGARSALAVIRLSGPNAHRIGAALLSPWRSTPRLSYLSTLRDPTSKQAIDRGIVTVYAGPSSYTGEDMIELSLHGGEVGPALAINALLAAGARPALPGELTRRALLNGKMDLLQAEAVGDLIDARSRAMHDVALLQLAGHLSVRLAALREQIIEMEALLAYDVDFPEEDDGPVDHSRIRRAALGTLATIDTLLSTAATGEMIRGGAAVVIAGAPNAGKSSLFNALVGTRRAIVTDIPGTTRDALEAMIDIDQWPIRLVDTAGLRVSDDMVERLGIEVAEAHVAGAVLVLVCGENVESLSMAIESVRRLTTAALIAVGTKSDADAISERAASALLSLHGATAELRYIPVSAHTGAGLAALAKNIAEILERDSTPLSSGNPIITRERHRVALTRARSEVAAFLELREGASGLPATVAAVHLHSARGYLEELVGVLDVEDVLDRVFSSFCVGK